MSLSLCFLVQNEGRAAESDFTTLTSLQGFVRVIFATSIAHWKNEEVIIR
ncbi:MAG: hypothetical protein WCO68_03380 [Verrucomicrobiota bacterium]